MKNKREGIKQPVGKIELKPRVSRHGKLLTDVYTTTVLDTTTDRVHVRKATEGEIAERRGNVIRALASTTSGGKKNGTPKKGS